MWVDRITCIGILGYWPELIAIQNPFPVKNPMKSQIGYVVKAVTDRSPSPAGVLLFPSRCRERERLCNFYVTKFTICKPV